jgi:leucyl-tRNA synthetase
MNERYNPAEIEPRWQRRWEEEGTFTARRRPGHPKLYVLDMFPYPSGAGLHVGHPEGYTATDIIARYKRMKGFDVLHPMGWDAFGLPAEQYAIEKNVPPAVTTAANIATFKRQLQSLGFSYDWSREVNTTDPGYVKWTQWIFLQLFKRGLAFQAATPVNWCPALGTVLANEEVIDGKSERGGYPVVRLPIRQWMLKITAYGDRLLGDLEGLDWPETRQKQEHWIGRSEGASVHFALASGEGSIEVFTTRPDTLFGATYMVIAPEHAIVERIVTPERREAVLAYRSLVSSRSDQDRTAVTAKKKTGEFTGAFAINPVTGQPIPIWVADFVLASYGTGAIMSVPGHDVRDFAFARQFGLPIVEVVSPDGALHDAATWQDAFVDEGIAVRSGFLDGKTTAEARRAMIDHLVAQGVGAARVNYKLRDWVFSRQRYWGEPIPIYFPVDLPEGSSDPRRDAHTIRYDQPIAVEESELPLRLPELSDYKPGTDPSGPLARAVDWRFFQRDGRWFARETNTMPQWAGSCWYYLRFLDPQNDKEAFSQEAYDAWMPVDLYVGGSEHAVLHLLYARFWHKVLHDAGYVKDKEPFTKLVHQGLILGEVEYAAYFTKDPSTFSSAPRDPAAPASKESGWGPNSKLLSITSLEVEETDSPDHPIRLKSTKEPVGFKAVSVQDVVKKDGKFWLVDFPEIAVEAKSHKMSKSRGNVVNPDEIVKMHGADALRVYEMFMGPLDQVKPWQTNGVVGVRRFLDRVWSVCAEASGDEPLDRESERLLHKTIQKVTEDIEAMRFNTAVSAMMILANRLAELPKVNRQAAGLFALILSPFAPHLAEEIWSVLGHTSSLAHEPWPSFDPALVVDEEVEIAVQVNGKVRSRVKLRKDASEADARAAVAGDEAVLAHTQGKTEKKFLYVPGRIINLVVG